MLYRLHKGLACPYSTQHTRARCKNIQPSKSRCFAHRSRRLSIAAPAGVIMCHDMRFLRVKCERSGFGHAVKTKVYKDTVVWALYDFPGDMDV